MKNLLLVFVGCFLIACSGGSSDSGGMVEPTLPGSNVPASFVGTYTGSLTVTASALGISETESIPITVTVTSDGMVSFAGDDDEEAFTVGLGNDGAFSGNLPINEDPCSGSAGVTGTVDGTTASGNLSGNGTCNVSGLEVDVTLEGSFSASR
ncbi:MAG: hypothetical protein JKX81_07650 [Arenicella sp.]|nr:hypothetical protein [Arenicella sp.]